jgi:holo-[acyl-carrier protein] synthase
MEDGMVESSGLSVGIDLVSVARIEGLLDRWGRKFLHRVYTDGEIRYCLGRHRPAMSFAARFAAKEAFVKAVASRSKGGIGLKSIEVVVDDDGIPHLRAHGPAATALGAQRATLSISHDRDLAIAIVITSAEVST